MLPLLHDVIDVFDLDHDGFYLGAVSCIIRVIRQFVGTIHVIIDKLIKVVRPCVHSFFSIIGVRSSGPKAFDVFFLNCIGDFLLRDTQ